MTLVSVGCAGIEKSVSGFSLRLTLGLMSLCHRGLFVIASEARLSTSRSIFQILRMFKFERDDQKAAAAGCRFAAHAVCRSPSTL
jgi:hypothetical protein